MHTSIFTNMRCLKPSIHCVVASTSLYQKQTLMRSVSTLGSRCSHQLVCRGVPWPNQWISANLNTYLGGRGTCRGQKYFACAAYSADHGKHRVIFLGTPEVSLETSLQNTALRHLVSCYIGMLMDSCRCRWLLRFCSSFYMQQMSKTPHLR